MSLAEFADLEARDLTRQPPYAPGQTSHTSYAPEPSKQQGAPEPAHSSAHNAGQAHNPASASVGGLATVPTPSKPDYVLFDTGPSLAGWSRLSTFMKCPYLFARRYVRRVTPERLMACTPRKYGFFDDARSLGTSGHTGLAHWLAIHAIKDGGGIIAADQLYDNASLIMPPEEAIATTGASLGVTKRGIDAVIATFRDYTRHNTKPPGRPIAVESMIIAVVGWRQRLGQSDSAFRELRGEDRWGRHGYGANEYPGEFGFWVVRDFDVSVDSDFLTTLDGRPVRVARLRDCPKSADGSINPREGARVFLTRRLDATFCTATWRQLDFDFEAKGLNGITAALIRHGLAVDIDDHKFSAMPFGEGRKEHYEQDGQFACARVMGAQVYGKAFSGVYLNSLHRLAPYTHGRVRLPATGFDQQLAWQIWRWEIAIAQEYAIPDVRFWLRDQREANCKTEMGRCDLYYHCRDDF